jgi:hypothetical protein
MASVYIKHGNSFTVTRDEKMDIHRELPPATFVVKRSMTGFYLDLVDAFDPITKVYGNATTQRDRIINTFLDRPFQTGVLLTGQKGTGKTLIARLVSERLIAEHKMPVIMVNDAFCDTEFKQFISDITQPCVIFFDEFEKVYGTEEQEQILTLLDGTIQTKKLFVLTCNNKYKIDTNLTNRPGRIYYSFEYSGLEEEFIIQYCEDKLNNKESIQDILTTTRIFDAFSFDMLKALVEEINRYNETPSEALKVLNISPTESNRARFTLKVFNNNTDVEYHIGNNEYLGNPLSCSKSVEVYLRHIENSVIEDFAETTPALKIIANSQDPDDDDDEEDEEDEEFDTDDLCGKRHQFHPGELVSVDRNEFIFVNKAGLKLVMKRYINPEFSYGFM